MKQYSLHCVSSILKCMEPRTPVVEGCLPTDDVSQFLSGSHLSHFPFNVKCKRNILLLLLLLLLLLFLLLLLVVVVVVVVVMVMVVVVVYHLSIFIKVFLANIFVKVSNLNANFNVTIVIQLLKQIIFL